MDFDPLGIFLVTTWTGGERLLFRYPTEPEENCSKPNIVLSSHPFALKPKMAPQYSVCKESQMSNIKNGIVVGFDDCLLANLLISAKSNLCKRRYEIKVTNVIFVGFLHKMTRNSKLDPQHKTEKITFNVVFALHAGINTHFIQLYQDLSEKISLGLIHEEERTAYMSTQKQLILDIHESIHHNIPDKTSERSLPSRIHERISVESSLGVFLKNVFENICEYGNVDLFLNNWIRISFAIAPKLPRSIYSDNGTVYRKRPPMFSKPSMLLDYLREMRPYHSFLLLEDKRVIQERLTADCSPVLSKLLKLHTPLKSIDQMAAELDVALTQVRQVVCSLVVWGYSMIIYPIYDSNIYLTSPSATLNMSSPCHINFSLQFPNLSLVKILSEFSSSFSFGHHRRNLSSARDPGQGTGVLVWLLQQRLVYQLHTYPYVLPMVQQDSPNVHLGVELNETSFTQEGLMTDSIGSYKSINSDMTGSLEDISPFNSTEALFNGRHDNSNEEDELFHRMAKQFFNGNYHLEAIMYRENINRTQLCHIIDRFRDKIYVFKHEEPYISYWVSPEK